MKRERKRGVGERGRGGWERERKKERERERERGERRRDEWEGREQSFPAVLEWHLVEHISSTFALKL